MKKTHLPHWCDEGEGVVRMKKPTERILQKYHSPLSLYERLRKDVVSDIFSLPFHLLDVERFIIFDLETTGFSREKDDIIEIGAVEVEERKITGLQFHSYAKSTIVHPLSTRIHGITNEFLEDKPQIQYALRHFLRFVEGKGSVDEEIRKKTVIISHNLSFDKGFLETKMKNIPGDYKEDMSDYEFVCSMLLFKKMFENHVYDLDSCCHFFGIDWNGPRNSRHGALIDSKILAKMFLRLLDVIEEAKRKVDELNVSKKRKSERKEDEDEELEPASKKRKIVFCKI